MGVIMKNKQIWSINIITEPSINKSKQLTGLYANDVLVAKYESKTNATIDCDKLNGNWNKNRLTHTH
jgi:hypothetical protein